MRKHLITLCVINALAVLLVTIVTVIGFRDQFVVSFVHNFDITEIESNVWRYKQSSIRLYIARGGIRINLNWADSLGNITLFGNDHIGPRRFELYSGRWSKASYPYFNHYYGLDWYPMNVAISNTQLTDKRSMGFQYCSFEYETTSENNTRVNEKDFDSVTVPYGVLVPVWLVWSFFFTKKNFLVWRGYRRTVRGHCANCDYDLGGLPGGLCPECGSSKPASVRAFSF